MSRISEKIREILKLAESSKITDKKKCVAELLDSYRNEDALKEICQNSEQKTEITWLLIMHTAHKLVLNEAERPSKETTIKNNERQAIINLVINTIRHSNEGSTEFLKSNELVSMILQILDNKLYTHYQDTYLGILVTYILSKNTNHSSITPEQWRELLVVCTKLYRRPHVKKHVVLDALQMIVEYSFLHTNLLPRMKTLLLFLERIFEDVKGNNEQLTESFYKLSNSVCRQIATESRITLCKFSENIAMGILHLNGSEEKYRLLLLFLQIHHPGGTSKHDDGAYAYDWSKWRELLRTMCSLIQENCKLETQWRSFVEFASEVVKQIVDTTINLNCSLEANSFEGTDSQVKRRRIMNRMENVAELVTESSPEEVWSLLKILTETLRKYPQCLKPQDLAPLLQRLTELAQSRDESIMNNLYNLAAVLMKNEVSSGEEMQDATIHWSKIWDMLLRSLGANQNEEMGHLLIRCFIQYNRMPNANALLRLYLTKTIRWSLNSVCTLRQLCERVSLPEDASTSVLESSPSSMTAPVCDRTRLLEWLLIAPWQKLATRLPVADMCALSMDLILNSRCRQNVKADQRILQSYEETRRIAYMPHRDIYSTDLLQICQASLIFKIALSMKPVRNERYERNSGVRSCCASHVSYVQDAFNFLKKRLYNIFQEESSNDEVYITLMKIAFLARLLSILKFLGIMTLENIDCPLIDVMKSHLTSSFEILTKITPNRSKYTYLLSVARALSVLYGATYDADVANMIVSASTVDMLRNVFELLNFDDTRRNCDYYKEHNTLQERRRRSGVCSEVFSSTINLPREGVIRLQVVEALASFCALHIGAEKLPLQTRMMRNLLSMQQDFTNAMESRMSLIILESFTIRDQSEIHREYGNTPLECLLKVCRKDRRDEESSCRLLNLLPYFFKYTTEYNYSPEEIIYTLSEFYKRIYRWNCGVLVHMYYMKCVCNCVQVDPKFLWSTSNDDITSMLDSVLDYIGNELFLLRSQAIRCLQELLSLKNVADKWKERIFVKVEQMVFKLFDETTQQSSSTSQNLEENQLKDEKETRTATALIALSSIACASGVLHGRALYTILRLTVEKELNIKKVQKVLLATTQHTKTDVSLVEDNLNYLLTTWTADAQYPLEKFPWILAGSESIDEFFRKHINHIVPILVRNSNLTEAVLFCTNCAGVAFGDIFEDVFPSCFAWLISSDQFTLDPQQVLWDLLKNTRKFEKKRGYARLLFDRLQDILVELVQRLHDEDDFKRILSIPSVCFPAMDPPHFTRAVVDQCLDRLERNFLEKPLTRMLVEQQPAALQKTLLHLASTIQLSRFREDQLKRLHQYAYFCLRMTWDLAEPFFNEMAAFLIRDVCYSLLHFTKNSDETFVTACCKFLDLFLRLALPARPAEIRDILRFVVANLISLIQKAHYVSDIATSLLRFLIIEQKDVLQEAIAKLGSFPNHEIFRDVRETHNIVRSKKDGVALCLEDELERFLDVISEENAECTLEDLADLTQQLSSRKKELKELHRKLGSPYPEDSASVLHRLVFKLVKLMESSNSCISMEATKCLGEVGPMDSTVALRPIKNLIQEADHTIEILTYRSVSMLTRFLVENAMDLRKVSTDALYAVLSTSCGRKLSKPEYLKDLSNIFKECAPLKIDYIQPFCRERYITQTSFRVDVAKFHAVMVPENTLWTVKNSMNYTEWIVKITCNIAEFFVDSYLKSFLPVCELSIEFCELILPTSIYLIIYQNNSFIDAICNCINQFFRYHFAINHETEASSSHCDRKIVRRMLDVVNHIRAQLPDGTNLKLDYIYLAKAAHKCSAYYTALLFAQLACESISTDYPDFSSDPRIDYIYERQPEIGRVLQDIMLDTYMNISDPDAVSGAGSSHLLDHDSRVQYYARTNRWDQVMLAQDIELSHNGNHLSLMSAKTEMANALHYSGLQFLQWQFLGDCVDEKFSYECAWRLSNWNLPVNDNANYNDFQTQPRLEQLENAFHAYHYHSLKSFHENDRQGTKKAIESARKSVIRSLRIISLESNRTVNEKLSQLRLLREIEQLSSAADSPEKKYPDVLRGWHEHQISLMSEFDYVEPILWQRIIMFRIRESVRIDPNVQTAFFGTCLDLAKVAESQGAFPVAARALHTLMKHGDLSVDLQNQLLYRDSLLAWMKRDQVIARRLLRNLLEKKNPKVSLKAEALRVYGDWMAETKSENPQAVIQKYYLESIKISETIKEQTADVVRNLYDTQVALARFADAQYEQITAYMNSPVYESLKEYACGNDATDKMNQAQMMKNNDLKRAMMFNQKQSTNDAVELKNIEQERRKYLAQALLYYVKTLQCSEEHNMLIFRLVALWVDNMLDEQVNEVLLDKLNTVPSFKFIPLVPQLAAHVSNIEHDLKQQGSFSVRIFEILERCALEHPYHTLPVLLALKNLHSDDKYDSVGKVAKKEERRVLGAKKLLQQLANSPVSSIVHEMESLSRALVSLAYWQPKGKCYSGKCCQIPQDQPISKIKNLNNVLLPTLSLPVRPSGNYNDVIGVRTYQDTCEFVGGMNAPKKIICVGTDGIHRRQLIKGKDDLRQDAVMQQVFTVMNKLLRTCKETKRRNLHIRTYKVVPLTQRSGVLEWCDNTVPITAALIGSLDKPGLHKKYYPRDLAAEAAKKNIMLVAKESNKVKLKVFLECCKLMRPAFHHFFEEKYRSPEIWVERTLTYTRSVATTSIAGYILGLGDRHLSNILIDERTAEVVHIDFGVAFEQGKVLPIPETIPFRLTRDIEVAMGVSGIEGTMRRSCEVTMTMLRDQRQIIITLLQVLLYDPLFTWTITPEKACQMQSDVVKRDFSESSERAPVETNKIAKRALLRIEQKLRGTEDGLVSSVPGQVEKLLQEARDPANLCRIYCGWQPYL